MTLLKYSSMQLLVKTKRQGFTLLELSIVLVIIGLIIGGITVGADMIRSAELNSVVSDFNKYKVAANSFKLKYNAIPGDMDNAQAYWGVAASGTACATTASTGPETCNGDGDGVMESLATSNEWYRFWQHLANSEIISGSFSGVSSTSGTILNSDLSSNVPTISGIDTVGITPYRLSSAHSGDATYYFSGKYNNILLVGEDNGTTGNGGTNGQAFTPAEMLIMDSKIDDGKPALGRFKALWWTVCTTAANQNDVSADYQLSNEDTACSIVLTDVF